MTIQWFPGHMSKTRRLLTELRKVIDIAIIILDARCPKSSFSPLIYEVFENKPVLIIFSKSDLADKEETSKWVSYYQSLGFSVSALNLLENGVHKKIVKLADEVLASKREKEKLKGMKERRMKMVIAGVPNVGKSTLINRYTNKRVVNVGNKAGVTKQLQWIRVDDKYELLDSPGLLWPKFEEEHTGFALAATKAIKNEILPTDDVAIFILKYLHQYYPKLLEAKYEVTDVDDVVEVYEKIGRKFGLLSKGNMVDFDKVSERILNDAQNIAFGNVTWDRYE